MRSGCPSCCCHEGADTQPVPGALCPFKPQRWQDWEEMLVEQICLGIRQSRCDRTGFSTSTHTQKCLCIKATAFQNLIFTSHFIIGPAFPVPRHAKLLFLRCRWYNYLQVKLSFPSSPLFDFLIFTLFPFSLISCIKLTCCKFWRR